MRVRRAEGSGHLVAVFSDGTTYPVAQVAAPATSVTGDYDTYDTYDATRDIRGRRPDPHRLRLDRRLVCVGSHHVLTAIAGDDLVWRGGQAATSR